MKANLLYEVKYCINFLLYTSCLLVSLINPKTVTTHAIDDYITGYASRSGHTGDE
jgi:hypothetical protein